MVDKSLSKIFSIKLCCKYFLLYVLICKLIGNFTTIRSTYMVTDLKNTNNKLPYKLQKDLSY